MGLMDSLGLDQVEADPNAIADGKYGAVIYKAGVVGTKTNKVQVLISYKINDGGKFTGKEKAEFFTLGEGIVRNDQNKVVGFEKPTMTEQQKPWFKKRLIDLGIPESKQNDLDDDMLQTLIGTEVIIGIKNNGAYVNINFVERRNAGSAPAQGVSASDPFSTPPASTPTGSTGVNISDL